MWVTERRSLLRMVRALTEADGPSWREKLPPIPSVPLSVREKLAQQQSAAAQGNAAPQHNGSEGTHAAGKTAVFDVDGHPVHSG